MIFLGRGGVGAVIVYSGYGFSFSVHCASAKTRTQGIRMCYPLTGDLHKITQGEGTHITAKEMKQ